MNILLAGSTGFIGGLLVKQLCADDRVKSVASLIRTPKIEFKHAKLTLKHVDFDTHWPTTNDHYDTVLCCLGSNPKRAGGDDNYVRIEKDYSVKVAEYGKTHGAIQCGYISSVSAAASGRSVYGLAKHETELALESLNFRRLHLFQPCYLTGRPEFHLDEKMGAFMARALTKLLPIKSGKRYTPVCGETLATAMHLALFDKLDPVESVNRYHYPSIKKYLKISKAA